MNARIYEKVLWTILKNRGGYTAEEIADLRKAKWTQHFSNPELAKYWIKVEMVKTNRCTAGWQQGDCFYFDNFGMLIARKAPATVCPHAIATLSPAIYAYLDRITRGAKPEEIVIDHVSCTDPGFDYKGLGNNTMRISLERIPAWESLRNLWPQLQYLFRRRSRARGPDPGGIPTAAAEAPTPACAEPARGAHAGATPASLQAPAGTRKPDRQAADATLLAGFPLSEAERKIFAASPKRMKRLAGIAKFEKARIAVRIVESKACLAGHRVGETIYFDSMGRLLPGQDRAVCTRLIHRAWYRLIMVMDRMADADADYIGDGRFAGEVPDVKIGCYSAELPFGDCGRVVMEVAVDA